MRVYLDTEYNGFRGELISIAMVSENGDMFYEVIEITQEATSWVKENVIPVLNKKPKQIALVNRSVGKFLCKYDEVTIIADWLDDIKYLCELLVLPNGFSIRIPPTNFEFRNDLSSRYSRIRHNALEDAKAIFLMDNPNANL